MNLALKGVTVKFGAVTALDRLTLSFPAGSQALLWGPAGGGKTILLKLLAGLVLPTTGDVQWGETRVQDLDPEARRTAQAAFGFVFQTDALFDSMSVLDNVRLPLRKRGVAEAEATARATEALTQVGRASALNNRPEDPSGGSRKRAGNAPSIGAPP